MDIVDELRQMHSRLSVCPDPMVGKCVRCAAADEIEKLRKALDESRPAFYGFFVPVPPRAMDRWMTSEDDFAMYVELAKAGLEHQMRRRRKEWGHDVED